MKVKFQSIDQIESFLDITQSMESDVIVKQGSLQLDAKSSMGMMKIPLGYAVDIYVIEKKGINEVPNFIKRCELIGVIS